MTAIDRRIGVALFRSVDDLEMGVLADGRTFLTGRTLARLCGVVPSAVIAQRQSWDAGKREGRLAQMLAEAGIDRLHEVIDFPGAPGGVAYAFTEEVCMVFLEYYAFEVREPTEQAEQAYRKLARAGLRAFVYSALGYDPNRVVSDRWRQFHDRTLLASAPIGYFSVFKETADFALNAIRGGLPSDDKTIPDISLGKAWGTYWNESGLARRHGERQRHEHNYPEYFPQAASNPQEIWVYPVNALGEFRIWMHRDYIPEQFPKYLNGKVRRGALPASIAEILLLQAKAPELPPGEDDE